MPLKPMKKTVPKTASTDSTGSGGGGSVGVLTRGTSNLSTASAIKNLPIQDRMIEMIKSGNSEGVIAMINENLSNLSFLNTFHSKSSKHPLAVAAEEGRLDVIQELLKHQKVIEVDLCDKFGMTAILYAAKNGELKCLQELYQTGAGNLLALTPMNETALYLATLANKIEMVKYLVSCEIPIEAPSSRKETVLSIAIKYEYYDIADFLLESGADINIRRTNGDSPLFAAVFDNRPHTVTYILDHGGNVNHRNDDSETPLMIACRHGYEEVVQILLDRHAIVDDVDVGGRTALIHAAMAQKTNVISFLFQRGALPDIQDRWGYSALAVCCSIKNVKFEIIHMLIAAKCNVNSLDRSYNTPLIKACKHQNRDLAKFLLDQGADINLKNIGGKGALDFFPELTSS